MAMLFPTFIQNAMAVTLDDSTVPPSRVESGENVTGAILFFSYIVAALYFTCYILLSIYRAQTQNQPLSKVERQRDSFTKHGRSRRVGQARYVEAYQIFCTLALTSFTVLSWNMLNFLLVSYSRWSSAREIFMTSDRESIDKMWHKLHRVWTWATDSNLFQSFAEDLVSEPARWKVVRAALIYSYAWNSWMSALGHAANIPDLWAYFVLDQILPISFTQNLFCVALTQTARVTYNGEKIKPDRYSILCLRLAGLLCYLTALYWIPSTVNTVQFFPTLFALRILLLAPYLVDNLAHQLKESNRTLSNLTVVEFNKCLLVVSIATFAPINFSGRSPSNYFQKPSSSTNYAAAALSNDMVLGYLGGVAFLFLYWRRNA